MPYVCQALDANPVYREYYGLYAKQEDTGDALTSFRKRNRLTEQGKWRNLVSLHPLRAAAGILKAGKQLKNMDVEDETQLRELHERWEKIRELQKDEFIEGLGRLPTWLTELDANRRATNWLKQASSQLKVDLTVPSRKDDKTMTPDRYLTENVKHYYGATPDALKPYNITLDESGIKQLQ